MPYLIPHEDRVLGRVLATRALVSGNNPFLTVDGRTWSFAEVHQISQAVARGLRSAGVRRGEPVMVMLDNSAEFILAWFAIALLDAVTVPVNTAYTGDLLAYVAQDAGARVAVTSTTLAGAFAALAPARRGALATLIVCGDGARPEGIHCLDWAAVAATPGPPVVSQAGPDDMAFICYTSGTTGPSKGVMLPNSLAFQTVQTFVNAVGMRADDKVFSPLPLFHGMSRSMATLPALALGAQVHLAPRFSATTFWDDVRVSGATISTTIFTIPPVLKRRDPSPRDRDHRVRVMFNAHHDLEFEERFNVRLVEAHGMTEVGLTIYTHFPERKLGTCGQPGAEWEVRLVDENDGPVPAGVPGELLLRPRVPGVLMQGYVNKPQATLDSYRGLWFRTGDLMRCDDEGWYTYAGRKKERIRRRGENISAYEVESMAAQHPALIECAVLGVPAGDGEDDVYLVAAMREAPALTPSTLHAWLAERLPRFMVPRYIEFRAALPKTGSAKIERHVLMQTVPAIDAWDSLADKPNTNMETKRSMA
ncbi:MULTISPECIES: AMP-binding protein [unclassified Variovorax]|uniref:AMP-binding protein n=1 Tax=unclassified Variovorax TaxID=663243 RepID=UPI001BD6CA6E|nr:MULTISPECIES: AMP-binding protein [unclassified Variovorax]